MADQFIEVIADGKSIGEILRSLIDSRIVCKLEIPGTLYNWVTKLLEIRVRGESSCLVIDRVAGIESALARFPEREVSLEFMEKGGVSSQFKTKIIECHTKEILSELPGEIHRNQKRQYVRAEALPGTEISFFTGTPGQKKKAQVKDYSAGGIAFYVEKELKLGGGELLTNIELSTLAGENWVRFHIPRAVVRHMVPAYGGRAVCAVEFLDISKETRDNLVSHVFNQQKIVVQRTKR